MMIDSKKNTRKIQDLMAQKGMDVLIAFSPENVFYTSNLPVIFSGHRGFYFERFRSPIFVIIPRDREPVIVTSQHRRESILGPSSQSSITELRFYGLHHAGFTPPYIERPFEVKVIAPTAEEAVAKVVGEMGFAKGNVGIERSYATVSLYEKLRKNLPDATFKDADGVFLESRKIKTTEEVDALRMAAKTTEAGIMAAFEEIREGAREIDLFERSKRTFMEKGCEWNYMNITAGENGTSVSHPISSYQIRRGDVIRWDGGAIYGGYNGDVARNAVLGKAPEKIERLHKVLAQAEEEVIHAMKPGVRISDLHKIGIEAVRKAGYPKYTCGRIGHGVGLDVVDPPTDISSGVDETLKPNMVFAVEICYFVRGAGLQPEDMVRVTENGVEELSTLDRGLYHVP